VPRLPGCGSLPVGFSLAKLAYNGLLLLTCLRMVRGRRFAAVHAIEEAALWAVPLARMRGVPAIVDLDSDLCRQLRDHGSWPGGMLAVPAGWLRRLALRRAAAALTVSRALSEIARSESPAIPVFEINDIPIESARRQPDVERLTALRARYGLTGRSLVVYTGNYDRRQGLPELIQAMAAVRARYPECLLLVVGGEPEQVEALQARIEADGLGDAVRLIGARPPDTMPEYMGLAEVLVSPRLEPYITPLKIFSYMASGRPIVATDLPTHTQVLDAEAAILVPPTPGGLAEGILRAPVLGRVLAAIKSTTDYEQLYTLAQAVQALPVQLDAAQAQAALGPVLDAIRGPDFPLEAVQALAGKVGAAQAQAALGPLLDRIQGVTHYFQLAALAEALNPSSKWAAENG
jgi:glycosyltransferase involved in cell wall biosynthesis